MPVSDSIAEIMKNASFIRKMFEEGAKLKILHGPDAVCDFSIGNPDMVPPPEFQDVLMEEAGRDEPRIHGYMPNAGYPFVRKSVAEFAATEQGVPLKAENVLMTCGAGGALNVALRAIVNPGDEVLSSAPCFVEYGFYCSNYGASLKLVPSADDFDLNPRAFADALSEKTAAVIINSPNNPTGRVYPAETLKELAARTGRGERQVRTAHIPYQRRTLSKDRLRRAGSPIGDGLLSAQPGGHQLFQGPFPSRRADRLAGSESRGR